MINALQWLLPLLDASLILASGLLIVAGRYFIARKRVAAHRGSMLMATVLAGLFLIVYLIRWALLGTRLFTGQGASKIIYLGILSSHVLLAIAIIPLVAITLSRALRGRYPQHRRIARWTWPIWLYVAITGWVVYWMLYHFAPG